MLYIDAGRGLGSDLCAADFAASDTCTYLGAIPLLALALFLALALMLFLPVGLMMLRPALGPMDRLWSDLVGRRLALGLALVLLGILLRVNGLLAPEAGLCFAAAPPWPGCRMAAGPVLGLAAALLMTAALLPLPRGRPGSIGGRDETGA